MRLFVLFMAVSLLPKISSRAQSPYTTDKGSLYVTWGYHRDFYSKSTIHLKDYKSDDYDFTLYHAKAKDQVDIDHFGRTALTVPQYVFRIGYFLKKKKDWGIEFSWDHLKYVVRDNQTMHLKGTIRGTYYDKDTLVTPKFVHFEHTNGNNYAMVSVVRRYTLLKGNLRNLNLVTSAGVGLLVPKTDSRILGNHNDGPFRISGFVVGASAGLRYDIFKYFYLESSFKGAFADYTSAKVYLAGRAKHHFFSIQNIFSVGMAVPL